MPFGVRTVAKKDYVTNAIALRRHTLALEHDRSFEDHNGLVEIVVPVELAFGAGPDQGPGSVAYARRQQARASFRIAFNNPGWLDRRRLENHLAMRGFNQPERHRSPPTEINWHGFKKHPGGASCRLFPEACTIRFSAKSVKRSICRKRPFR